MPRFRKLKEGANGWTRWQFPVMDGYLLACCDCGLVHKIQFVVVKAGPEKRGRFRHRSLPTGQYRVKLRAKRQMQHTAKLRKKDGITLTH